MMDVNNLKVGTKVVDRWYSFHKQKSNRYGVGKVVQMTKSKRFIYIKFSKVKEPIKYDREHVEQFTLVYKRGMEKYPEGFIPPNHSSKTIKTAQLRFKNKR